MYGVMVLDMQKDLLTEEGSVYMGETSRAIIPRIQKLLDIAREKGIPVVYANLHEIECDPLTKRLFREAGYKVLQVPLLEREVYSGTEVRRRILSGGDWKKLVPSFVARYIEDIGGVERIKEIAGLTT